MVFIRDLIRVIGMKDNRSVQIVELQCDNASELPTVDFFRGRRLHQGSIAWVIFEGAFYALTSSGKWIEQSDGEEASTSNTAASALSASLVNKPTTTLDMSLDSEPSAIEETVYNDITENQIETVTLTADEINEMAEDNAMLDNIGIASETASTDLFEGVSVDAESVRDSESGETETL